MSRGLRLLAAATLLALGPGCMQLPDSGPVEVGEAPAGAEQDLGVPFEPQGPQRGETPTEIVQHFLEAMTANPIQISVAREFLSPEARETWKPDRRIITYAGAPALSGETTVDVVLSGANWLDAHGAWRGVLPDAQSRMALPFTVEDGEWRIDQAPNAMIIPEEWFQERFTQVSLYFFDGAAEILVPELVFVPRGAELPTSLVRGLLQGPTREMRGELRSFLGPGTRLADVSVPVEDGVAEIALSGELANLAPDSIELLAAQVAWTLRQDPTLSAARITIGDDPVTLEDGVSEFSLEDFGQFNPVGASAGSALFGLRDGRLVTAVPPEILATDGAMGADDLGLRDVSVSLDGARAVGVTGGGSTLLTARVDAEGSRRQHARTLLAGGTDLLHPAWDYSGRLWVVDRTASGARVMVRDGGSWHRLRVPGVTGEDIVDFLVSRDGTRLVAVVDGRGEQSVVASRLLASRRGFAATPARRLADRPRGGAEIRDLGWRSATDVLVLSSLNRRLSEVHTLSVDGSPATPIAVPASELLRLNGVRLVSAPAVELPAWVVAGNRRVVQLSPVSEELSAPRGMVVPTYAG